MTSLSQAKAVPVVTQELVEFLPSGFYRKLSGDNIKCPAGHFSWLQNNQMLTIGGAHPVIFHTFNSSETRTIFSGIKEWYTPEDLVGVKTMWVTNIPPKKTPFGESNGMLFACDTVHGKPYIVRIGEEVPLGSEFH